MQPLISNWFWIFWPLSLLCGKCFYLLAKPSWVVRHLLCFYAAGDVNNMCAPDGLWHPDSHFATPSFTTPEASKCKSLHPFRSAHVLAAAERKLSVTTLSILRTPACSIHLDRKLDIPPFFFLQRSVWVRVGLRVGRWANSKMRTKTRKVLGHGKCHPLPHFKL